MRRVLVPIVAALPLLTGGCIARTAVDIVTLPVKAASATVDVLTTSEEEADRNYGRKMRKAEAREGRERREHARRCRKDPDSCGPYDGFVAGRD